MQATGADRTEYERRLARVRELMASEHFDALLVVDDDSMEHPPYGDSRYLANFSAGKRAMAVIVPPVGEAHLVVPPGALNCVPEWARMRSWIADVRCTPRMEWPPSRGLLKDLTETLADAGLPDARIGVCGSFPELAQLRERFPRASFVMAERVDGRGIKRGLVERARANKSPWELDYLKKAQACAEVGLMALLEATRPGVRHAEAIAEGERRAIRAGADEASVYMSSGTKPWVWGPYRGDLEFQAGDLVAIEFNARVNGYVAQIARGIVLGTPTSEQRLVLDTARESQRQMVELLAVGVTGGELWDVGLKVVHDARLEHYGRYGHGMGLSIAESFDIMAGDDNPIEDGFCIEVHSGVISPRTKDSVLIGDQFIVQGSRVERLSTLPVEIEVASVGSA